VHEGSLHPKINKLHRRTAVIWNEIAAEHPELQAVAVPSFRKAPQRIDWATLMETFRQDVDNYSGWCRGDDFFAEHARERPMAERTVNLRRQQLHAAVTALIQSGAAATDIKSLQDLVAPAAFKCILKWRYELAQGRPNAFNRDLAEALVQTAREWVKPSAKDLAELRRLASKMPMPPPDLTTKNKRALTQFDDPAVLRRLIELPTKLWREVKQDQKSTFRTLAKAHAAIAIAILVRMPVRLQNLAALTFDTHLILKDGPKAISSLQIAGEEVKNGRPIAFDIVPELAKMLVEYRDRVAPSVLGRKPKRLFETTAGEPKAQASIAWLIKHYLRTRAGIVMTPHQFRHLSAKILLDDQPGAFELVKQLLGHASLKTTTVHYAGIDSRRAGRHHFDLIEKALAAEKPAGRKRQWRQTHTDLRNPRSPAHVADIATGKTDGEH
jgi:integrase